MIALTHSADDGTRTYRNRRGVDVAYAGDAESILTLNRADPAWQAYGAPTQPDGLFLLVAPGYRPEEIRLDGGAEGWLAMSPAEIEDFTV